MTLVPSLRASSLSLALIAMTIVLGTFYVDVQDTSPGRLSATHLQHPGLVGSQNCNVCHGGSGQSMTSACLNCHQPIESQLHLRRGFHGSLAGELGSECANCHSEHHGKDFVVTNERSFALAGVSDPQSFQHKGLGFRLRGIHASAACEKCHPNANVRTLPRGETRFLGVGQSCTNCHRDVHEGGYGPDCASCHGQQHPFLRVAGFAHTDAFQLDGSHAKAACKACHPSNTSLSVASLLSSASTMPASIGEIRTCRDCHESPHEERFVSSIAEALKLQVDQACQHCHPPEHGTFAGSNGMNGTDLHDKTGFSLESPHDRLACAACHDGFGERKATLADFRRAFPGRRPDDCSVCHRDPHQGQFSDGLFRSTDCLTCHNRHGFTPSAFTIEHHAETRFPLRGQHLKVACDQCHRLGTGQGFALQQLAAFQAGEQRQPGNPAPELFRIFHGTTTSCKECHRDPHNGQFEHGHFRGSDCDACHSEESFQRPIFALEQHAQSNFALTGAHTAVACNLCHQHPEQSRKLTGNEASPAPRTFHGTPTRCSACHKDVHEGRFDQLHLPKFVDGNTDCARCHNTEGFHFVRAERFDHALWTGYDLRGAHQRAKCEACHAGSDLASPVLSAFSHARGRNCQACHSDPHVGQFGPTLSVNCTHCHVEGESFRELVFDHQQHSRFPLDRDHRKLECSACHRPQPLPGGTTAVRYKPLGTQCGDCHVARGPRSTRLRGR